MAQRISIADDDPTVQETATEREYPWTLVMVHHESQSLVTGRYREEERSWALRRAATHRRNLAGRGECVVVRTSDLLCTLRKLDIS